MESFIKIGSSVWAVEVTHTDTQTDRQTHTQTHTLGSIATYSVKMTEYKNYPKIPHRQKPTHRDITLNTQT